MTTKKEVEKKIADLREKFGNFKINLTREDGALNGEGVWTVPATQADVDAWEDNSSQDQEINVFLLNEPLEWSAKWGDPIKAKTKGQNRPCAYISEHEGEYVLNE